MWGRWDTQCTGGFESTLCCAVFCACRESFYRLAVWFRIMEVCYQGSLVSFPQSSADPILLTEFYMWGNSNFTCLSSPGSFTCAYASKKLCCKLTSLFYLAGIILNLVMPSLWTVCDNSILVIIWMTKWNPTLQSHLKLLPVLYGQYALGCWGVWTGVLTWHFKQETDRTSKNICLVSALEED